MKRYWFLALGVFLFSCLIVYRAIVMPITHDEAGTWFNYGHLNVWSCLSNSACWGSANNHWLNTLLLQWSAGLFGDHPWALRLPNVLAGFLYFVAAALFSFRYIRNPVLQFAGFLLVASQIYLLDFFSLARGYGLMVCGVLWGIYSLLRYIEKYDWGWLLVTICSLVFSVLGNFTGLLPWAVLGMSWFVWLLLYKRMDLLFRHGLLWLVCAVVLWFLLRYPIKILSGLGEFQWGTSGSWAMMVDLMNNLLYGAHYLGESSVLYVLWGWLLLSIGIVVTALLSKNMPDKKPIYLVALLLCFNFIIIILQEKITGSRAPVGRKSIFLIPFIFTLLALGLNFWRNQFRAFVFGSILCLILLYPVYRPYPWSSCREWYYDAYYPSLLSTLVPGGSSSDSIRLGTSWIFNPALRYYQEVYALPLSGLAYQKPLLIDSTMNYYYVEAGDTTGMLTNGFTLEKRIGPFFLFKK